MSQVKELPSGQLFSRGSGPLVSVMIPTRGRPAKLLASIDSIISLAYNQKHIEILIKADEDDEQTIRTVHQLAKMIPLKLQVGPRGGGYADMHLWFNQLAIWAAGDWLLVWNDDARMLTEKWDAYLAGAYMLSDRWHGIEEITCMTPLMRGDPNCTAFFFLRRKVVEILGRFSAIPHCDTWVTTLMRMVNSLHSFHPIVVTHDNDEDSIFKEGSSARATTTYTIHGDKENLLKLHDAIKLQQYIMKRRRTL